MATKIQLETMISKIFELQYNADDIFSVMFYPIYLVINTSKGKTFVDTDGNEIKSYEK